MERPDPWVARLSEYLDGELSARQRRACEAHLSACADCAATLEALREVSVRAGRLRIAAEPSRDLWSGIERRLEPRSHADGTEPRIHADNTEPRIYADSRGLLGWLRPQFAAAAVLLVAFLAALGWLIQTGSREPVRQVAMPSSVPGRSRANGEHDEYDRTVATLEREAHARLTLDPHLVEVLDDNLATLDAAIATYRDALAANPADRVLRGRFDAARHRKIEVLQQAVSLAGEGTD